MRIRALLLTLVLLFTTAGVVGLAGGYSNGSLPQSALSPIHSSGGGVVYLARDGAASSWNTMRLCSLRQGVDLYTGGYGAYRPYAAQVYYYRLYTSGQGNLAAYPGTSNHGLGHAIDLDLVRMRNWIDGHGGQFGWTWGEAPSEWWHVTDWHPERWHRPDPGPDAANPRLSHGSGGACQQPAVDEARRRVGLATGRPFTSNMVATVKAFQRAHRLPADGVIGGGTWKALRGASRGPAVNPSVLRVHSPPYTGQDVAAVQGLVNARLKDVRNSSLLKVDGVFGAATAARLRYLQKYWWRIPVTGMTTATTRAKLKVTLVRNAPAKVEPAKPVARGPMYLADVSEHNGTVNFRLARRRVEGVILRATWTGNTAGGLHVDSQLSSAKCQQARNAGLKLGFYAYDVAGKGGSPERAADFFTSTVWRQAGCRWRTGDFLPAHDMEKGSSGGAVWSDRWRARVERNMTRGLGRAYGRTIEYGGSFVRKLSPPDPGRQSALWLPAYGNNNGAGVKDYWKYVLTPPAWKAKGWWWAIYQYWSEGRWSASGGAVDFNIVQNPNYWLPRLLVR